MQSIAILGRQPALGLAELESLYGAGAVTPVAAHAAGLSLPADQVNFKRLGGSTRLAAVVAELSGNLWKDVEKQLAKSVVEIARTLPEGKIQLGLSAIHYPISAAKLNAAGLTLKKVLRGKTGASVRVAPNPEPELNTAAVTHNHLTGPTGIELLLIAHGTKTIVARTVAVQDIDSYTLRDRGRPKRDARVGMLPPKLAQIIINLAAGRNPPGAGFTLLDPFCGTGVVLQEALLMGYNAYGTDLEPRMIDYTGENLDWLDSRLHFGDVQMRIEPGDATSFSWQARLDAVAGETYLGRPFTAQPGSEILARTVSEVNLILRKFLQNVHGQLVPGTPLCLAIPAWAGHAGRDTGANVGHFKHLPLIDDLSQLGYNRTRFEHVRDADLLYYREDQIVARELLVLTRK